MPEDIKLMLTFILTLGGAASVLLVTLVLFAILIGRRLTLIFQSLSSPNLPTAMIHKGQGHVGIRRDPSEYRGCKFSIHNINSRRGAFSSISLQTPGSKYPRSFVPLDDGEARTSPIHLKQLPTLELTLEDRFDRLGKRLAINLELQTGDEAFDQKIYINTQAQKHVALSILRGASLRRAIIKLLEAGYTSVYLFEGTAPVSVVRKGSEVVHHDEATLARHLDWMVTIAQNLPRVEARNPTWFALWTRAVTVAALSAVFSIPSALFYWMTNDFWPTFSYMASISGVILGLVFWVPTLCLIIALSRGYSNGFAFARFSAFNALVGLCCIYVFLTHAFNALPDTSPREEIEAVVLNKYHKRHKKSSIKRYYLEVDPAPYGPVTDLRVSEDDARKASDRVILITRKGALGWRWVEDIDTSTFHDRRSP